MLEFKRKPGRPRKYWPEGIVPVVVEMPEPEVVVADPISSDALKVWPEEKPLPKVVPRRALVPCPKCRRVLLDDLNQAVILKYTRDGVNYYYCKDCGAKWCLPIE